MNDGMLGRTYSDGESIIRQGEVGDRMFVIQNGTARVTREVGGQVVTIATLGAGDVFGEMAIFEKEARSATVTADGDVTVLSIDKAGFLRRVHEDPSLAFRILKQMSGRIREISEEVTRLRLAAQEHAPTPQLS